MAIGHVNYVNQKTSEHKEETKVANIIVLFEVKPTKAGMKKYLDLTAMIKPLLAGFEGFIRAERFSSLNEEGKTNTDRAQAPQDSNQYFGVEG